MKTLDRSPFAEICRELLGMERSAFENYTQALEFYRDDPLQSMLLSIRSSHDENLGFLVEQLGASATDDASHPDRFSSAIEGASAIFGEGAALMALEAGEAEAAKAYYDAIVNPNLPQFFKDEVRDNLLPRVKANMLELEMARTT